jgi:hypothetical protein
MARLGALTHEVPDHLLEEAQYAVSATSMGLMTRLGSMIAMRARSHLRSGMREMVECLPARPTEPQLRARLGFAS